MRLETAPRSYRDAFTVNYRSLFPDEARNYRIDVLEASADQYAMIWVNGDRFEFSQEAIRRAEVLQRCWLELGAMLERWSQAAEQPWWTSRPRRSDLRATLVALDFAWASFEHRYISELIDIEEKARSLVAQASERERLVQLHEARAATRGTMEDLWQRQDYLEAHERLAAIVARLNSVANHRRKGRDDLSSQVIVGVVEALRQCEAAERSGQATDATKAASVLAASVLESFSDLREYLRDVTRCMERVDPHLCNNVGLVNKLVDWEEKWEIGNNYVKHDPMLGAVCGVVAQMRTAQRLEPCLTAICNECDVELFLILPRIMWLSFLEAPDKYAELMQLLLPRQFEAPRDDGGEAPQARTWTAELAALAASYRSARELLLAAWPAPAEVPAPPPSPAPAPAPASPSQPSSGATAQATSAKGTLMASLSIKGPLHISGKLRQRTPRLLSSGRGAARTEAAPQIPEPREEPVTSSPLNQPSPEEALEPPAEEAIWELLLRRAVANEGKASAIYERLPLREGRSQAQAAVEDLMRELERWSIQLQRHCPDDFNQCCAIIMQCLAGESGNQKKAGNFQV